MTQGLFKECCNQLRVVETIKLNKKEECLDDFSRRNEEADL